MLFNALCAVGFVAVCYVLGIIFSFLLFGDKNVE